MRAHVGKVIIIDVTPAVLKVLSDTRQIVCVKEESGDIRPITDVTIEFGDRFSLFCGVDDLIVETIALGATGASAKGSRDFAGSFVTGFRSSGSFLGRMIRARSPLPPRRWPIQAPSPTSRRSSRPRPAAPGIFDHSES